MPQKRIEVDIEGKIEEFITRVDRLPVGIAVADSRRRLIAANRAGCSFFGCSREEISGASLDRFILPDDRDKDAALYQELIDNRRTSYSLDSRFLRKDGSTAWGRLNVSIFDHPAGHAPYTVMSCEDISGHKNTEALLRENRTHLKAILDNANLPIFLKDIRGGYIFVNRQYEKLAQVTNEAIQGKNDFDIFPEPVAALFRSQDQEVVKKKKLVEFTETIPLADGIHTFITAKFPVHDENSELYAIGGACTDITELKRSEAALRESEEKFRATFYTSPDSISITAKDGTFVEINPGFTKLTGYTREEVIGRSSGEIGIWATPKDRERLMTGIREQGMVENLETTFRIKDGSTKTGLISSTNITLAGEPHVLSIARDVTDRKQLEIERQTVQKLKSVGILAGGIAHDFNNLLTAIFGNISLAKMSANNQASLLEFLTHAEKASMRAQDLTRQLLTFSRGGAPVRKAASIKELIADCTAFTLSGSNVKSAQFLAQDLWPVLIDEGQISQVIQNIVKNADHAMPGGGTITISAENTTIETRGPLPLPPGRYVRIAITDQGEGIEDRYLARIFDPYFSTKQKGSGLGLAIAFSIVQKHEGLLQATSAPGAGTTFTIHLPAADILPPEKIRSRNEQMVNSGRILIMDDEESVLMVMKAMLTRMGFDVETATNGREAIALFTTARKTKKPFAAVILDLTIPGGLGGLETMRRLLEIDPATRAIVSSGYADDPIMANYADHGFMGVVTKPFSVETIMGEINRVTK